MFNCGHFHENFMNIDTTIAKQEKEIAANTTSIESKADATLAINIESLEQNMNVVKDHIQKEEKQGINVSINYYF